MKREETNDKFRIDFAISRNAFTRKITSSESKNNLLIKCKKIIDYFKKICYIKNT